MTELERHTETRSVPDQALQWFVRLHAGDCSDQERAIFGRWLAESDAHRTEYDHVASLWRNMDELTSRPFPELEQARHDWKARQSTPKSVPARLLLPAAMAAVLALILAGVWWWTMFRVEMTAYRTAKGEQRTIALADGSKIEMNTDTALAIRLSGQTRKMVLEHGEAIFTVAHESRPFLVLAGTGRIRDLGTQFIVRRQSDRVIVAVLDGSVEVSPEGKGLHDSRVLHERSRVSYTQDGFLFPNETVDVRAATAWREGKLLFEAMPLAEAIKEVARYHPAEIQLVDPSLATLKISGVFHHTDLNGFLFALEHILPVKIIRLNDRQILVAKANPT